MSNASTEISIIDPSQHEIHFRFDGAYRNIASVQFIDVAADGSTSVGKGTTQLSEQFVAHVDDRRCALRAIPSDEKDINIKRIETFRRKIGAPNKATLYLGTKGYQNALELLDNPTSESEGYYEGVTDVALVKRNPELESLNGTEITEAFAIHEIAHSSATINTILAITKSRRGLLLSKSTTEFVRNRMGFYVRDAHSNRTGSTLEEGYADLERGLYVRDANLVTQFTSRASNYDQFMRSPIPSHYMYKQGNIKEPVLTFSQSTIPAAILEILIEHDQEFLNTLRKSRQDVAELANVACRMEHLMPGLHDRMLTTTKTDGVTSIYKDVLKRFKPPTS